MHSPIPRLLLRMMFGDVRGDVKMFYRHAEMCFRGGRLCNYRFRCRILIRFDEGGCHFYNRIRAFLAYLPKVCGMCTDPTVKVTPSSNLMRIRQRKR